MGSTRIILLDNGSLQPAATRQLRLLSAEVGRLLGVPVLPVSVLHSHKIDPALLDGQPAVIFEQAVHQAKADGVDELIVLPLFIGPSKAITEYVPQVFAEANAGEMKLTAKPVLYGEDGAELLEILVDHLRQAGGDSDKDTILLCDHGSPIIEVTRVRDALARDLSAELAIPPARLIACSMERREGPEYAFNEPLLATALQQAPGDVIVLMLFLLPGRHAGPDGDVATIAKEHAKPGAQVRLSPLLASHPRMSQLIAKRSGLLTVKRRPQDASTFHILGAALCVLVGLALGAPQAKIDAKGGINYLASLALFVLAGVLFLARPRR
jgi:sirohydrochlorin ferrochelatase